MKAVKNAKWALVLAGGGARGFAHIGVLKGLEEQGFPEPSLVVGTSMGAIIGGIYACGMKPAEIARFVLEEFDMGRYLDGFAFQLNGPVGKFVQAGQILGSLTTRKGIDSGALILAMLERLSGGKTFEETRIPFRCNAVDLVSGKEVVFSSGSVAQAMRASMSVPVFFEPLAIGEQRLVDGGLADNMPVSIARQMGFRRVLAVEVNMLDTVSPEELKNVPHIAFRSLEAVKYLMQQRAAWADLTLHAADSSTPLSFSRKKELIELGEQAVRESVPALEGFFSRDLRVWFLQRRSQDCGIGIPRNRHSIGGTIA